MAKTPNTTPQPNYPDQITGDKPQPGAEHAVNTTPTSADLRGMDGSSAQSEPLFWVRLRSDGCYEGPIHNANIEEVRKTSGAWAPLYLGSPPLPAAQKRYRLLKRGIDTIQADDEFLRDADSNWQIDPQGIFVGMPYMSNVLLPARRAIEPGP